MQRVPSTPLPKIPAHYQPDMLCVAHQGGEVRCRCEGHTPVVDVRYSIRGSDLLVVAAGVGSKVVGRVTPAPADAAERLRVLVLIADWTCGLDDHGDSAHDIDHWTSSQPGRGRRRGGGGWTGRGRRPTLRA